MRAKLLVCTQLCHRFLVHSTLLYLWLAIIDITLLCVSGDITVFPLYHSMGKGTKVINCNAHASLLYAVVGYFELK